MRRTRKFTTAAALASGGLVLSVATAAPTSARQPDSDTDGGARTTVAQRNAAIHTPPRSGGPGRPGHGFDLADKVRGKAVLKRLGALQDIADDNDGNRAVGTSGYEASAQYVERTLRKAGYHPERQYFDVEQFSVDTFSLEVSGVELAPIVMSYSSSTPEGGVTGNLVAPSDPLGCDATAWDGVDATGKIAVVSRGSCAFADKALAAGEAGAAGVIVYNNTAGELNGTLGGTAEGSAPAVGVTQDEGAALLEAMAAGPVSATLDLQTSVQTVETFNVIAETRGGDADSVVMAGSHLDGVEEGPGINDNGSGSASILETAVQLAKATRGKHPKVELTNKVRFAWWGAEEIGLVGSTHYVEDLQANDPEGLADIASYLNFDMVGSPNYTVGVYDADESTYDAPVTVPDGSAELEAIFTDYFDASGQAWVDSPYSGRSDYQAFIEAGIPAAGAFSGADGVKTEAEAAVFGGEAGAQLDPNYHSAEDDIDNVSREALGIFVPAIAHAVQVLAEG